MNENRDLSKLKVALVHDWLTSMGGGENVVEALLDIFPNAPIYTSMAARENLSPKLAAADIRTSFLQKKVKGTKVNHRKYLPWMPAAFESFDLNEYDLVISSCSCCSKGVITNPKTIHICYCHTPTRYVWEHYYEYTKDMNPVKKRILKHYMNYLRMWDYNAAQRVDYFIANSKHVAARIKKYYRRDAEVIYPPVRTDYFTPGDEDGDFFLVVSRLVEYKRIDLAVEAFNELGLPLVVIGDGPERKKLESTAKKNIIFMGRQPNDVVRDHMRKCKALIFPGEEDFGITPIEVQACGRPAIAFGKGGAVETVVDSNTGRLFSEQIRDSLVDAIHSFDSGRIDHNDCEENAALFSESRFIKKIDGYIADINAMEHNVYNGGGVSIAVLTYNAEQFIGVLLMKLLSQSIVFDTILVIDSESTDSTCSIINGIIACNNNVKLMSIKHSDFNHGATRRLAFEYTTSEYVLFITQDALPVDTFYAENLLNGFSDERVGATYGRQQARLDASPAERLIRLYNYPTQSRIQSKDMLAVYGFKGYFFSDVCSAYRRTAYQSVGGFDETVRTSEDTLIAAKLIHSGWKIHYNASAAVAHSHSFSLREDFLRNYDIAYVLNKFRYRFFVGNIAGEGVALLRYVLRTLCVGKLYNECMLFMAHCAIKYFGYISGKIVSVVEMIIVMGDIDL
jgi:glycosyltransferase involved in cell wall biosynthesis